MTEWGSQWKPSIQCGSFHGKDTEEIVTLPVTILLLILSQKFVS